jgi:hypothetical protein
MKRGKYLLLFLFTTFLFSSCGKDENHTPDQVLGNDGDGNHSDTVNALTFNEADFPVKVGNWWKYLRVDFNFNTVDTLLVSVDSLNNNTTSKEYFCKLYRNEQLVDSSKIIVGKDSLVYRGLNLGYSYFSEFKMKFPFQEGSTWQGFYPTDTVMAISSVEDFNLSGQNYDVIFNIKRSFNAGNNYSLTQFIILSPGVGVVRLSVDLYQNGVNQKQNFSLIDYHLQ